VNRKLVQKEKLHARTLIAFLNDTILLVLHKAGMKTSVERLEIIMTLKTMDRGQKEGTHFNISEYPLGMRNTTLVTGIVEYVRGTGPDPQQPMMISPCAWHC